LLLRLREAGLITYPSPLLGPLLDKWPDVLAVEVLTRLDPTDLSMLGRVDEASRAAVVSSGLPRAGATGGGVPLKLDQFCGSAERLAWAKANDCPWVAKTCALAAAGGRVEVLRWAREHDCPADEMTCARAAAGGHMEMLIWAREHGCPWMESYQEFDVDFITNCCALAADGGYLEMLKWLREHDCPWDSSTCALAAEAGHLEVLKWARENGCDWDADLDDPNRNCCSQAAGNGHLEVGRCRLTLSNQR